MSSQIINLIGQALGVVAVALGFLSFQMNTPKKLLAIQSATCIVFCTHYLLIGAISAFALNAVGIVRNFVYYNRDKKFFSHKAFPIIFAVLMAIMGFFSWQGIHSLLVIIGLIINTLCLALGDSQSIRKSILVSSPLVLIYDIIVFSIGGAIYESVVIVSSIIGIIRSKKSK